MLASRKVSSNSVQMCGEVENVSVNHKPRRPSLFSGLIKKNLVRKLREGQCVITNSAFEPSAQVRYLRLKVSIFRED